MNVYLIAGYQGLDKLGPEIEKAYPGQHYVLKPSTWFVADTGTVSEVAKKINLLEGKLGAQGVVVAVATYAGWAPSDLWEWIKTRVEMKASG